MSKDQINAINDKITLCKIIDNKIKEMQNKIANQEINDYRDTQKKKWQMQPPNQTSFSNTGMSTSIYNPLKPFKTQHMFDPIAGFRSGPYVQSNPMGSMYIDAFKFDYLDTSNLSQEDRNVVIVPFVTKVTYKALPITRYYEVTVDFEVEKSGNKPLTVGDVYTDMYHFYTKTYSKDERNKILLAIDNSSDFDSDDIRKYGDINILRQTHWEVMGGLRFLEAINIISYNEKKGMVDLSIVFGS